MTKLTSLIRRYFGAMAVYCAITLTVLDSTLMNVALPTLSDVFHVSESSTIWIVNIYQLVITMFLLSFASLGDVWGYRKVFKLGVVLFTIASAACALSTGLEMLVVCRAVQGIGAACVMSVNPALLRLIYPEEHLGRGLGVNAMVVAVSTVGGPTLCGAILSIASWHWLFIINVPIGIAALWIAHKHLPENVKAPVKPHFDRISAVECALIFGLFVSAIDSLSKGTSGVNMSIQMALALIIGYFFIKRQRGQVAPLLPVDLLKIPIFAWSVCTSICSFCAQMMAMVSLPFLLQNIMHFDVLKIGVLMAPWALGTMVCANIAGRLVEKINGGILGCIGLTVFACGLLLLYFMPVNTPEWGVLWRMLLCGMGFGFFQTPNNVIIMTSAPKHRSGGASGMQGTARVLGQTLGTTLVALLFNNFSGETSSRMALLIGAAIAALAAVVSYQRKTHSPAPKRG